jgi:hypothetical protein
MKKSIYIIVLFFAFPFAIYGQGKNHNWLLGYSSGLFDTTVITIRATFNFSGNQLTIIPDTFPMPFDAAQANISDENGNLLMVTNGCWIADATGNQMQNGGGLNPNSFTNQYCGATGGLPYSHSSVFLPFSNDTNKYILIHETGNWSYNAMASELYYTVIDKSLNSGLGAVVQKNQIAIQDSLTAGIGACKHANGRDWWVIILRDNSDIAYKLLVTSNGIESASTQHLNVPKHTGFNGQPQFSPDGSKFAYHYYSGVVDSINHSIRIFDFDRCTGNLTLKENFNRVDSLPGIGLSFSSNSKYLYYTTITKIFQLNTDTADIASTVTQVATYDNYCYPYNFLCTNFWFIYLAATGKMYIPSGSSVIDLTCINSPDSAGLGCNVQQHSIRTPCYFFRSNVHHPNYYLGPVLGSVCDSLSVGTAEYYQQIQNFQIFPNPLHDEGLKISYQLPQNLAGEFEVYDLNAKLQYHQYLPPWSSLQYINLPLLTNGMYQCVIRSGKSIVSKKLVVVR